MQDCAKQIGVDVQIQTYTFDDMWTRYPAAIESKTLPDVAKDTVRALSKLPYYVGVKFASMFGLDEDTFFMMSKNMEKLDEFAAKRKIMADQAGVDALSKMPSLDELRAQILGLFQAVPAKVLAQINAPAQHIVGVLQAKHDEDEKKAS